MPFHLTLKKLSERSFYRTKTLLSNHPTLSLLSRNWKGSAALRFSSVAKHGADVKSVIRETEYHINDVTEIFTPFSLEGRPGHRVLDLFKDQVHTSIPKVSLKPKELTEYIKNLDSDYFIQSLDRNTVSVFVDGSV